MEKKITVLLLFCVSVGSFCAELTVVFSVCLFYTNSYAFKKRGEMLGYVLGLSFLFTS